MKVGIVSDVHMRSPDGEAVLDELAGVVERFEGGFRPDRVVVLGDLIQDEDPERDREHVRQVRDALAELSAPVTYLLGNHDVENLSRAELGDLLGTDGTFWGRIGGTDLLYLDSSAPGRSGGQGAVSAEQLSFLDRELGRMDRAVLFVHHPIGYRDLRENHWFGEHPERAFCGNKREVNEVIEDHGNVLAAVNGHVHETDYTRYRGVHHVTVNAFNKELPDVPVTGTYAEMTVGDGFGIRVVEGDRMEHAFEVPG